MSREYALCHTCLVRHQGLDGMAIVRHDEGACNVCRRWALVLVVRRGTEGQATRDTTREGEADARETTGVSGGTD